MSRVRARERRAKVAAALVAAIACAAPSPALADDGGDAVLAERQRTLFAKGNELFDQQKLEEAEAAYLEAFRLKKTFDVAGNLGNVEADLRRWRAAAEHLAFALASLPAGARPAQRQALTARLAEAEKQVSKLRVRVDMSAAEVLVDGQAIKTDASTGRGATAVVVYVVYVDPGAHVVEARLAGYATKRVDVDVAASQLREVELALTALPTVPVAAGPPVMVPEAAADGPRRGWVVAGGVTAGVLVIAGGALAGAWAAERSKAASLATSVSRTAPCPTNGVGAMGACSTLKSDLVTRTALGNASIGGFAAAGAIGIGTLVYALAASSTPARASGASRVLADQAPPGTLRCQLAPSVGLRAASISVRGVY